MSEKDDLQDRVNKFRMMELPGQPFGMHMGTMYLVNDLWREVEQLRRQVEQERGLVEGYKAAGEVAMLTLIILVAILACVWTATHPAATDPWTRSEGAAMIGAAGLVIALCGLCSLAMGWL